MGKIVDCFSIQIKDLSHSEKHVLYFIDDHLELAKKLSLTEMAEHVNVSTTTIVRMCQKLKLQGFSELKFLLKSIKVDEISTNKSVLNRYQEELVNTICHIHSEDIKHISQLLIRANKVIIVSVGLSKMIGEYLSKLFMQVGTASFYVYESHMIDLVTNAAQADDLIIFISSSGQTKTLINVAEKLNYKQVRTISITNTSDSGLGHLTTYNLYSSSRKIECAGYDITARSTLMILVDILFESYLVEKVSTHPLS